jgi:hypothetical protein
MGIQRFDAVDIVYAGLQRASSGYWDAPFFLWVIALYP